MVNGYKIAEGFADSVFIRKARKDHKCCGGYDGEKRVRVPCLTRIQPGETYVEYIGESALYESGHRYHLACAVQQDLIERET